MAAIAVLLLYVFVTLVNSRVVSHPSNGHVHLSSHQTGNSHVTSGPVDQAPVPLQTYNSLHKGDKIWMNVMLDGIHMDELPEVYLPMAVLRERKSSSSRAFSRRARDTSVTAYCATAECMQLMVEYEQWRHQHGYADSYGRWG